MQKLSKVCTLTLYSAFLNRRLILRIKLKASFGGQFHGTYGDIIDVPEETALTLISKSLAEKVEELEPPKLIPKILKGKKSGK